MDRLLDFKWHKISSGKLARVVNGAGERNETVKLIRPPRTTYVLTRINPLEREQNSIYEELVSEKLKEFKFV